MTISNFGFSIVFAFIYSFSKISNSSSNSVVSKPLEACASFSFFLAINFLLASNLFIS